MRLTRRAEALSEATHTCDPQLPPRARAAVYEQRPETLSKRRSTRGAAAAVAGSRLVEQAGTAAVVMQAECK